MGRQQKRTIKVTRSRDATAPIQDNESSLSGYQMKKDMSGERLQRVPQTIDISMARPSSKKFEVIWQKRSE
jgi:hypothetical protein